MEFASSRTDRQNRLGSRSGRPIQDRLATRIESRRRWRRMRGDWLPLRMIVCPTTAKAASPPVRCIALMTSPPAASQGKAWLAGLTVARKHSRRSQSQRWSTRDRFRSRDRPFALIAVMRCSRAKWCHRQRWRCSIPHPGDERAGTGAPRLRSPIGSRSPAPIDCAGLVNRLWLLPVWDRVGGYANDFGKNGSRPTHPELLDWLANGVHRAGLEYQGVQRTISPQPPGGSPAPPGRTH